MRQPINIIISGSLKEEVKYDYNLDEIYINRSLCFIHLKNFRKECRI
jgi:hypothetical protein